MSAGGLYFGNGRAGRIDGRDGGRGRGRESGRGWRRDSNQDDNYKKLHVTHLVPNPTSAQTVFWMTAMVDYGRTQYRHGLHKLCDPDSPQPKPVVEQISKPNKRAQVYVDYELEVLNQLRVDNPAAEDATEEELAERETVLAERASFEMDHQWQEDVDMWKLKAKHREDKHEDLIKDSLEMFGYMWQHLTIACRTQLEEKYGKPHFQEEDPKVLADSIREYFIGRQAGAEGNLLAVETSRRDFHSIEQRFDQTVSSYWNHINQSCEVLIRQEVTSNVVEYPAGTNVREEKLKKWPERERVQHFICGLHPVKFQEWKKQLQWHPELHPFPDTMSEAYKQAVDWEEQWRLNQKRSGGSGPDKEKAGVYAAQIQTRNSEYDADGVKLCWKFRDTKSCSRGDDCRFSHKPAAPSGKQGGNQPLKDQVSKAAKEVKFDQNSAAGGGPGPKKG